MPMRLDFTDVDRPDFSPIPENDYEFVVSDFQLKDSKADDTKTIAHCVFEVASGEYEGRRILHWQGMKGDQSPYAKVMLEAIYGEPIISEFEVDEEDIIGRNFEAHVTIRPDQRDATRKQNRISYFILPFDTTEDEASF